MLVAVHLAIHWILRKYEYDIVSLLFSQIDYVSILVSVATLLMVQDDAK